MAARIPKPDERFTREEAEAHVKALEDDKSISIIALVTRTPDAITAYVLMNDQQHALIYRLKQ